MDALKKHGARSRRILIKKYRMLLTRLRDIVSRARRRTRGDTSALNSVTGNIKYFSNPGPCFELPSGSKAVNTKPRVRAIAFYLPQFHKIEENNEWWGEGFTEWRNVARGAPRFSGHYQPRIPRDLGFYDLTDDHTLHAQAALAKANGIDAFCFYYYWFDGKRMMDKPLDRFASDNIDQQFCIMWANENWTRTWDGLADDVLMPQNYLDADEDAFVDDTARYMKNERYVRVGDRPLFILYRPGLLPDPEATLKRWRDKWEAKLGVAPWIFMVQGFGDNDPGTFGLDGAVEFPPHKVCASLPDINQKLTVLDPEFNGHVRAYTDVVNYSLNESPPDFPLIKTVSPGWDNDARRQGQGMALHGSTPAEYERWLNGAISHAENYPIENESIVFVNAWNEWAEGAYLEPDVHFGHAYLNATRRAVHGLSKPGNNENILLVGHDAHQHGAQMLLLNLAKCFHEQLGLNVTILLKDSGVLVQRYRQYGNTVVVNEIGLDKLPRFIKDCNAGMAICNTSVSGDLTPMLNQAGLRVISLIHEMPTLIQEYGLKPNLEAISRHAHHVVFPSGIVQEGYHTFTRNRRAIEVIKPQGTYKTIIFDALARTRIREELGIGDNAKLVMNAGYADLRKGFDLFLQTATRTVQNHDDVHFIWVGALSGDMQRWVQTDIVSSRNRKQIHLTGFTDDMAAYYSASDALLLTSREDPYPTVVLEAMNIGLPVIMFQQATGFDAVMKEHGYLIDRDNALQMDEALANALQHQTDEQRQARIEFVERECQLEDYCTALLGLLTCSQDAKHATSG